jgi:hypothetical protein
VVLVNPDTILTHPKTSHQLDQPVETTKGLTVKVQDVGEGHVHNVGESDGNVLGVYGSYVGIGTHFSLLPDIDVADVNKFGIVGAKFVQVLGLLKLFAI